MSVHKLVLKSKIIKLAKNGYNVNSFFSFYSFDPCFVALGQTERIRCLEYQRKHSSSDEECGSARRHHSSSSQEELDQNVQHQLSELQRKYTAEVALRQTAEQKLLTLSETNKSESNPQVNKR